MSNQPTDDKFLSAEYFDACDQEVLLCTTPWDAVEEAEIDMPGSIFVTMGLTRVRTGCMMYVQRAGRQSRQQGENIMTIYSVSYYTTDGHFHQGLSDPSVAWGYCVNASRKNPDLVLRCEDSMSRAIWLVGGNEVPRPEWAAPMMPERLTVATDTVAADGATVRVVASYVVRLTIGDRSEEYDLRSLPAHLREALRGKRRARGLHAGQPCDMEVVREPVIAVTIDGDRREYRLSAIEAPSVLAAAMPLIG